MSLPTDPKQRKLLPIGTGVLDYFPDALAAIAEVSRLGNEQHNPGQPLHWAKEKSTDHDDALIRHFLERADLYARAQMAWRALAGLQMAIEAKQKENREAEEKLRDPHDDRDPASPVRIERTRQVGGHVGFRHRLPDGEITTDRSDPRIDVV